MREKVMALIVLLCLLMADVQVFVSVLAFDGLRCGDEISNEVFGTTKCLWCVPSVDFPESGSRRNAHELLKWVSSVILRPFKIA